MKIKVCGVRRPSDVAACLTAKVDHVGLNFVARSKRCLSVERARALAAPLPSGVGVGVFEDASVDHILQTCRGAGLAVAQVHGALSIDQAAQLAAHLTLIRALPGDHRESPALSALAPYVAAFLFDGPKPGSGRTWSADAALGPTAAGRPTFLAGGLRPRTVAAAIRRFQPAGVDVASGVEGPDGQIASARVLAFTHAARAAAGAPA